MHTLMANNSLKTPHTRTCFMHSLIVWFQISFRAVSCNMNLLITIAASPRKRVRSSPVSGVLWAVGQYMTLFRAIKAHNLERRLFTLVCQRRIHLWSFWFASWFLWLRLATLAGGVRVRGGGICRVRTVVPVFGSFKALVGCPCDFQYFCHT